MLNVNRGWYLDNNKYHGKQTVKNTIAKILTCLTFEVLARKYKEMQFIRNL